MGQGFKYAIIGLATGIVIGGGSGIAAYKYYTRKGLNHDKAKAEALNTGFSIGLLLPLIVYSGLAFRKI